MLRKNSRISGAINVNNNIHIHAIRSSDFNSKRVYNGTNAEWSKLSSRTFCLQICILLSTRVIVAIKCKHNFAMIAVTSTNRKLIACDNNLINLRKNFTQFELELESSSCVGIDLNESHAYVLFVLLMERKNKNIDYFVKWEKKFAFWNGSNENVLCEWDLRIFLFFHWLEKPNKCFVLCVCVLWIWRF